MILKGYEIDKEGYYIGDYLYEKNNIPELENVIITEMPQGFFKSKWDGSQWIEGATQDYIDGIKVPIVSEPTQEERISSLESAMSALMGV